MSLVTKCCSAPVVRHYGLESPDNSGFTISTSWNACSKCNDKWFETLEGCECCGEGADHLTETKLGLWCKDCCISYADELMELES